MKLINCPICGTRISADSARCPECGFNIKEYFNNDAKQREHKKPLLLVCIFFLILLAAILFILLLFRHRDTIRPEESSYKVSDENRTATGVYSGNDHEILVLCDNGLANYYCNDIEFTELACPWTFSDNQVEIQLDKLHCVISAEIKNNDFSELIFKSDSLNWNTEVFSRLDVDPDEYITRKPESNDSAVSINDDGTLSFSIYGISFIIPKPYRDIEDSLDDREDAFTFVDNNVEDDYASGLLFYSASCPYSKAELKSHVGEVLDSYCSGFIDEPLISDISEARISGKESYTANISGSLNSGFTGLAGYKTDGIIAYIPDESEKSGLYILMIQTSDRKTDNRRLFENILSSAR